MSEQNVELVRALQPAPDVDLVTLFGDDDAWGGVAHVLAPLFAEGFEARLVIFGDDRSYHGLEGLRQAWQDWLAPWERYRAEIAELVDAGDRVLVITDDYGRRKDSSADVRLIGGSIWTVRDGKVARADFYADRDQARAAIDRSA